MWFKNRWPPGLINSLAYPRLIKPTVLKFIFFNPKFFISNSFCCSMFFIMFHQSQTREILAIKSYGFHEIVTITSYQIQWDLTGSMRLWQSNLIKSNGILWVPWDFKTQILLNPMESYGFHEIMTIKSYQISSYPKVYGSEGAYY